MAANLTKEINLLIKFAKEAARRLRYQNEKKAEVTAAAKIIADLLVSRGYIEPYEKVATVKKLMDHSEAVRILHEVLEKQKTKSATLNGFTSVKVASAGNGASDPARVNYRGYVPIDQTIAGRKLKSSLLGE